MADTSTLRPTDEARLGEPISLADLLALPPDGRRYARDAAGRLCLMAPDHHRHHQWPLSRLMLRLGAAVPTTWAVLQEPGVVFPVLFHLRGGQLPPSPHGPQVIEPDIAVFDRRPVEAPLTTMACTSTGLRLIIEVLSPSTWSADLGLGEADAVDRWRTYLAAGVRELWVVNVGVEGAPLPPGAGLFAKNAGAAWTSLGGRDLVLGADQVHGIAPITAGVVRSEALSTDLDVGALWPELA